MDNPFERLGLMRLRFALLALAVVLLLSALFVAPAHASSGTTQAQALSYCNDYHTTLPAGSTWKCVLGGPSAGLYYYQLQWTDPRPSPDVYHCCDADKRWTFGGTPTFPNPCTSASTPTLTGGYAGRILQGMSYCQAGVPATDGSGGTVVCSMSFQPSGPPTMNAYGSWHTPGTLSSAGTLCGGGAPSGSNNWRNVDGTPASDPIPSDPAVTPPPATPPKACGGGTCYDASADKFCATSGGAQFCVTGAAARAASGGCSSSGDSTLCAGSPTPPRPPADKVPDPATAVRASDKFTQADPVTGAAQSVTVNQYTNQGATPATSGQSAGDSGPAPASSTGDPAASYGGGDNCDSPPVCSGDAVMCGVAKQTWLAACQAKASADQAHKDLAGDGPPSDLDALNSKYGQGDVWVDADTSMDGTPGGQANAGVYDQTGFGFSTSCPLHPLVVPFQGSSFSIPFDEGCVIGPWLRALIIGFALYSAARITAGGRGD